MKFNVSSKALYSCVSAVSKVINSKNAMTILNSFYLTLEGDKLSVTASDMENTLTGTIEVSNVEGNGSFCVDAHRLVDLLKELPDLGITFQVDESFAIAITYPGSKFDFIGINGAEYPSNIRENADAIYEFNVPVGVITSGIDSTLFAVGTDPVRPQMMGILWDIRPDGITFVATDTRKLVRYLNQNVQPGFEGSFILPVKPASILKNIIGKAEEVAVSMEPKSVTFNVANYSLNCRFIKGNFPDYNRVIPQNNPFTLTVDRVNFLNAVRRVGVFVDPAHGLVKFKITPDKLTLKAQDNNFCTNAVESIPCDFTGKEMIIGFSSAYLVEIINTISTDEVQIRLSDPARPGVFVPAENKENTELLILLMPMTVQEF